MMRRPNELDTIDQQILGLLEEDARRTNSEIARIVGLSPVTVAERIARMRDIGIITRFTITVDPGRLGYESAAIVHFEPRSSVDAEGMTAVATHPAVRSCYKVTGESFLVLIVRVRNSSELNSLLLEFNEHGTTHTSVILNSELENRPWFSAGWVDPLPALRRRTRGY